MPTLLIIDDDPLVLTTFSLTFGHMGFTVQTATSAGEGLHLLTQQPPDVVLLDISLPDQSGLDIFHQIYRFNARIPVIFITGHGTTETAIEAMKLGAYDYFVKPVELDKLKELVTSAASLSQLAIWRSSTPVSARRLSAQSFISASPKLKYAWARRPMI